MYFDSITILKQFILLRLFIYSLILALVVDLHFSFRDYYNYAFVVTDPLDA